MNPIQWTSYLRTAATKLGFDQVAFCPAIEPAGLGHFQQWLEKGFHGEMSYLADRQNAYSHPRHVLDGVKSIMMLATNYRADQPIDPGNREGRVSCYAWGSTDYHDLIHARFKHLKAAIHDQDPDINARGIVDTAPMLEREFAKLAGIGWQGKNTMLISKQVGSYFFLSCLLLDVDLVYDQPFESDHCGTCTACLEACPTDAFPQPYVLDATRCISYLTIEHRSDIADELRRPMGDWIFGCDICQEVCPWNRHAPATSEPPFGPAAEMNPVDLHALFELDEAGFRERFRKTPLWRARRRGLLRNAAIVLGNHQDPNAIIPLQRGIRDHEPLVRAASAWALREIAASLKDSDDQKLEILKLLNERLEAETESATKEEMMRVVAGLQSEIE